MTLTELRQIENFTSWWHKALNSERGGLLWSMLQETHPLRFTDDRTRFSGDAAAYEMGFMKGYELCLERLRLASLYQEKTDQMPEATFEPDNTLWQHQSKATNPQ